MIKLESNKITTALTIYCPKKQERSNKFKKISKRFISLSSNYYKRNEIIFICFSLTYLLSAFFSSCLYFFNPIVFYVFDFLGDSFSLAFTFITICVISATFGMSVLRKISSVVSAVFFASLSAFFLSYQIASESISLNSISLFLLILFFSFISAVFSVNCFAFDLYLVLKNSAKARNIQIALYICVSLTFIFILYLVLNAIMRNFMIG